MTMTFFIIIFTMTSITFFWSIYYYYFFFIKIIMIYYDLLFIWHMIIYANINITCIIIFTTQVYSLSIC